MDNTTGNKAEKHICAGLLAHVDAGKTTLAESIPVSYTHLGHQDAIIRTENAVETLKNSGIVLEKLGYGIANWNRAQAQNRMEQMLGQFQNKIELVLANNDDMALGAIDAYEKTNLTESAYPVFFGIDGTEVGLEAVLDSKLSGTVYNDKEGQAAAMAKLAAALVLGEGMEAVSYTHL